MATIGSLVVDLLLKSAQFNADLSKAAGNVSRQATAMRASLSKVESGFTGLTKTARLFAGAFAGGQIFRAVQSTFAFAEQIQNAAQAAGLSTTKFQQFSNAAMESGSNTAAASTALNKFSQNVALARQGTGPLFTVLQKLNPTLLDQLVHARDNAEALQILAKGYVATANAGDQAAIRVAAMGKAAGALDPVIRDLANGFDDLSKTPVLTPEELKKLNDADNLLDRIGQTAKIGFAQGLAAGTGEVKNLDGALAFLNKTASVSGNVLTTMLSDFNTGISDMKANGEWLGGLLDKLLTSKGILPPRPEKPPALPGLSQDDPLFQPPTPEQTASLDGYTEALERNRAKTTETKAAADLFKDTVAASEDLYLSSRTPMEQYALALDKIKTAHAQGDLAARAHTQAAAILTGEYLNLASTAVGALGTLFKDSKGIAVAQAVINTAQAITATLAQYGATPWGLAASAVAAASGAAQIATIMSAQPGSGKKPTAGATAASKPAKTEKSGGGGTMKQAVSINLMGSGGFTRDQVRQLAEQLNGLVSDGASISVN
jgi:hypothetical protein